jgi:hypothetical protein
MLRRLVFTEQKKFDYVWEGWLMGTRAAQARDRTPNVEVSRRRAKISRKLKGASEESKRTIVGDLKHRDVVDSPEVFFEVPEYELLVKTLEETDWSPESIDIAFDVIDWVTCADKVE